MTIDTSGWSGDGDFTKELIEALKGIDEIGFLRVEDAPAGRSEASYAFISNEVFVRFRTRTERVRIRRLGFIPGFRSETRMAMSVADLGARLAALDGIGEPDYSDQGMLQYLRAHRIVAPYQTRGFKLVEMVRIYEAGTEPRRQT